jgi:hypothetical protein
MHQYIHCNKICHKTLVMPRYPLGKLGYFWCVMDYYWCIIIFMANIWPIIFYLFVLVQVYFCSKISSLVIYYLVI